ncbi:DgyrCDS7790 [Dimorphilus gyrociliatus]|uniref:DgyrCDS7790 n=1 Tax=Dimorphilus gyrociliatus TaxID=2664684 RepID=A0A7I8VUN3_9ANNE|nr:DgyrCDS7790 [Dimorphilus gyrociliatus]
MTFLTIVYAILIIVVAVFLLRCLEIFLRSFRIKNIDKKHVLITGCDSGFGYLLAKKLDKQGVHVVATCLTEKGTTKLEDECSSRLKAVTLDITDEEAVSDLAEFLNYDLGEIGLHGLVNNAGIGEPSEGADCRHLMAKDLRELYEVNTFAIVTMVNKFLTLLEKGKGRIVNMTSINGRIIDPTLTNIPYTTSKAASEAISDSYRILFKAYGIPVSVHIIEPGFIKTDILNPDRMRSSFERGKYRWTKSELEKENEVFEEFGKILTVVDKFASKRPGLVVRAYEHALFSKWPKKRYSVEVGLDLIVSYLPSIIQDAFVILQFYLVVDAASKIKQSAFDLKNKEE